MLQRLAKVVLLNLFFQFCKIIAGALEVFFQFAVGEDSPLRLGQTVKYTGISFVVIVLGDNEIHFCFVKTAFMNAAGIIHHHVSFFVVIGITADPMVLQGLQIVKFKGSPSGKSAAVPEVGSINGKHR